VIDRSWMSLREKNRNRVRGLWREFLTKKGKDSNPLFQIGAPSSIFFLFPERLENTKIKCDFLRTLRTPRDQGHATQTDVKMIPMANPISILAILHSYRSLHGLETPNESMVHEKEQRNRTNTGLYGALSTVGESSKLLSANEKTYLWWGCR